MSVGQVVKAVFSLVIGRTANIIFMFAFNAILVRILLKEDVGSFFITLSIINFFTLLATFGTGNIALRWFSEIINETRSITAINLLMSFLFLNVMTAAMAIITFVLFYYFDIFRFININFKSEIIIALAFWVWAQGILIVLTELFRAFGKFIKIMLTTGVMLNAINLIVVFVYFLEQQTQSMNTLVSIVAVNTVITACVGIIVARKTCLNFDNINSVKSKLLIVSLTKQIIKESVPSFVNKLGLYLTIMADLWLISAFYSKSQVADYAIAAKLAASLSIFLSIANGFVPTFIGKLKVKGKENVELFLRTVATTVAIPTLILFILLFCMSNQVITFIFGQNYQSASSILVILLLAQLVNVFVGSCSYTLVMEGKNAELMKISLFTGVLAILSALTCIYWQQDVLIIVWIFSITTILRNIFVYTASLKICSINTAIYVNPLLFIKSLKVLISKTI